jgi:hypothetical protein
VTKKWSRDSQWALKENKSLVDSPAVVQNDEGVDWDDDEPILQLLMGGAAATPARDDDDDVVAACPSLFLGTIREVRGSCRFGQPEKASIFRILQFQKFIFTCLSL